MEKKLNEIEIHLAEIKKDIKYHIKRTDDLEQMVTPTYKAYVFVSYLIKATIPVCAIITALIYYK